VSRSQRPEVRWGISYAAVILTDFGPTPTMHAAHPHHWSRDGMVTRCNLRKPYQEGAPPVLLSVRHARLFCRPCKTCTKILGPAP
jgi:hypothetical protein